MYADKKIAIGCLSPTIILFVLGIFLYLEGKLRFLGLMLLIASFIGVFFTVVCFIQYQLQKFTVYYYCKVHNLNYYDNCNKIVDNVGFNKIYKLRKKIDFFEGIGKETNGVIKKYIHGIISDDDGNNNLHFFLLEFRNIYFPKFYFYTPQYLRYTNGLSTEADKFNPVLTYELSYRKALLEVRKKYGNKLNFSDYEEKNCGIYLINGKNPDLINQFFNENIFKDFKKLANDFDFIETKENFLILTTSKTFEVDHAKRCKVNEKLLSDMEKLVKHIN